MWSGTTTGRPFTYTVVSLTDLQETDPGHLIREVATTAPGGVGSVGGGSFVGRGHEPYAAYGAIGLSGATAKHPDPAPRPEGGGGPTISARGLTMTYTPVPPARWVEPLTADDPFPDSPLTAEPMFVIDADPVPDRAVAMIDIPYAEKSGRTLHLAIELPPLATPGSTETYPLVVFVQGSAWREQQIGSRIPTLAAVAERGYVVAFVEYRPSSVAPFPAQVRDVRTALRYLQDHASELHIEPGPVALWGDSSGAHTAVLTALTCDDPYFSDEAVDAPVPEIHAVVDYYGPTDISRMNEEASVQDHRAPDSPEGALIGGVDVLDNPELANRTVLMAHIGEGRALPPFLVVHGSSDRLVPFGQSIMLVEALREAGQDVTFYKVAGGDHGDPTFWKPATLDLVVDFIESHRSC